jgi:hypothetical protein
VAGQLGRAAARWARLDSGRNSDNVMLNRGMAINQPAPSLKRPRGRPPTPAGAKSKAEIQRAYRERLKASRISPADLADLHERFRVTLLKLELREQDVAQLQQRNAYLESELKLQMQHHTNALKDVVMLKQLLAEKPTKRR